MKKFTLIYLLTSLFGSFFFLIKMGEPGFLTAFSNGDVSGKGGRNLSKGSLFITIPLDVITSPFQGAILVFAYQSSKEKETNKNINDKLKNDPIFREKYLNEQINEPHKIKNILLSDAMHSLTIEQIRKIWDRYPNHKVVNRSWILRKKNIPKEFLREEYNMRLSNANERYGKFLYGSVITDEFLANPNFPSDLLIELEQNAPDQLNSYFLRNPDSRKLFYKDESRD